MKRIALKCIAVVLVVCCGLLSYSSPSFAADLAADTLFETHCSGCHLNGGNIIRRGKNLKMKALEKNGFDSPEAIATIISQGKGNMSAYSDKLNPSEIKQLADYVWQQAQQDWPA